MLEVASEKLTEREREYVKHFRQAQERGESFAEYCRTAGLKANEWHAVRHGMVQKRAAGRPPGYGGEEKADTAKALEIYSGARGAHRRC